jgi:hypothetical protein
MFCEQLSAFMQRAATYPAQPTPVLASLFVITSDATSDVEASVPPSKLFDGATAQATTMSEPHKIKEARLNMTRDTQQSFRSRRA